MGWLFRQITSIVIIVEEITIGWGKWSKKISRNLTLTIATKAPWTITTIKTSRTLKAIAIAKAPRITTTG